MSTCIHALQKIKGKTYSNLARLGQVLIWECVMSFAMQVINKNWTLKGLFSQLWLKNLHFCYKIIHIFWYLKSGGNWALWQKESCQCLVWIFMNLMNLFDFCNKTSDKSIKFSVIPMRDSGFWLSWSFCPCPCWDIPQAMWYPLNFPSLQLGVWWRHCMINVASHRSWCWTSETRNPVLPEHHFHDLSLAEKGISIALLSLAVSDFL